MCLIFQWKSFISGFYFWWLASALNPYFDKKCQQPNSPPQAPISSSQITSELIEQLLKLRAATATSSKDISHPVLLNSETNEANYQSHPNEVTMVVRPSEISQSQAPNLLPDQSEQGIVSPFVHCLSNLDNNGEDDDKLFIL